MKTQYKVGKMTGLNGSGKKIREKNVSCYGKDTKKSEEKQIMQCVLFRLPTERNCKIIRT